MIFNILVALHLISAVFWVGGVYFATFILLVTIMNSDEPVQRRPFLKRLVGRFRVASFFASGLLLFTGLLMLPWRSFSEPLRFAAFSTMVLGWCAMTAMIAGTIPSESFSGREQDIKEKEDEEWNVHRLYWIHVAVSALGTLILLAGVILAYTA